MRTTFFLILLLLMPIANSKSYSWSPIRQNKNDSLWRSQSSKLTYLAISIKEKLGSIPKNFHELLIIRKKMLSFSGIEDWNILKQKMEKDEQHFPLFIMQGEFKDHSNELNYFIEIHKYEDNQIIQVLMTSIFPIDANNELINSLIELHD
jgi:hypothetical protein